MESGGDKRTGGFPRTARLTSSAEFGRVFSRATRVADRYFTVLYRPNGHDRPRLGLAVSRKTATKATARNRIKRIARETFRQHQVRLDGVDIVLIAKPPARAAPRPILHRSLSGLWQRVAQRCEPS